MINWIHSNAVGQWESVTICSTEDNAYNRQTERIKIGNGWIYSMIITDVDNKVISQQVVYVPEK